jgi:flagellar motor switch protein FliG
LDVEKKLNGSKKVAVLMVTLGPKLSAEVLKYLSEDEKEKVLQEVANVGTVNFEEKIEVIVEFHQLIRTQGFISKGGPDFAKNIKENLEKEEGPTSPLKPKRPFEFIKKLDPNLLARFLLNEHPQTIALVLAYLPAESSSVVLTQLPAELQAEVTKRIATIEYISPEVLQDIESTLQKKLGAFASIERTTGRIQQAGGIQSVVDILNQTDRSVERSILERLSEKDPDLAEEIRKRMFTFEDITKLDDRSCQRVLREIDIRELAVAMKGASDAVREKVFKNMAKRAAAMLQEEMEYLGPVRAKEVEEAQQKLVNVIRQLEDLGEIEVARGKR